LLQHAALSVQCSRVVRFATALPSKHLAWTSSSAAPKQQELMMGLLNSPIVLVHGLFGHLADPNILAAFGNADVRSPDLRGYGQ
ncbi:hypothetical protein, partial [Xanthomonas oryzae]|uniref:hypothetical protein n=1 Tax=Xanthomonas oryzae TaxID=347 RepID=UPI003CEAA9F7